MSKYPLKSFMEDAVYTDHERAIYAGNPWIGDPRKFCVIDKV